MKEGQCLRWGGNFVNALVRTIGILTFKKQQQQNLRCWPMKPKPGKFWASFSSMKSFKCFAVHWLHT